MTIVEGLTIAALFAGPIAAVIVTRIIDEGREANRRKWEIFRNLMCFRRHPLSQGFVSSLNLLEVEFHDDDDVLKAWKAMYDHLCEEEPSAEDRKEKFIEKREKLRATLLQKVASSLGITINSLDMFQSGYYPQGWEHSESEELFMRRLLGEVLVGERPFPVSITNIPKEQSDTQPKL